MQAAATAATAFLVDASASVGAPPAAPRDAAAHTILLLQVTAAAASRTYLEFERPAQAVEGAIGLYEDRLREFNPLARRLKYTVEDLYAFFDGLQDLACLVFDARLKAYVPKPPEWIKQSALAYLQKRATRTR
jgi:hypothetical protein